MVYLRAFLNENLGDDFFVQIIAQRYPKSEFEIFACDEYPVKFGNNVHFVLSNNTYTKLKEKIRLYDTLRKGNLRRKLFPVFFRLDHRMEHVIARRATVNVYVIGSGFMEGGKVGFWQKLEERLYYANRPYLLGCNFGPFFSENYRSRYERLFVKAKDVCFRESYSYKLFPQLSNTRWESDIVFSYDGNIDETFASNNNEYVVISVVNLDKDGVCNPNKTFYYKFILDIADYYLNHRTRVVFVGFCKKQGDDIAIESIVRNLPPEFSEQIEIINYPQESISYILGVFKNAEAVFASRYHAGIIGMLYEKRTYFLSYSDKLVNVLKDIDETIPYIDINKKISVSVENFISQYGYTISSQRLCEIKESANRQFSELDSVLK